MEKPGLIVVQSNYLCSIEREELPANLRSDGAGRPRDHNHPAGHCITHQRPFKALATWDPVQEGVHSEPVGWSTLGRNACLAVIAAWLAAQGPTAPGADLVTQLGRLSADQRFGVAAALILLAVMAQAYLMMRVLHTQREIVTLLQTGGHGHVHGDAGSTSATLTITDTGLPVGTPAPGFELPDLRGDLVSLAALLSDGRAVVLVFVDPNCVVCTEMLPKIAEWRHDYEPALEVIMISRGTVEENRAKLGRYSELPVLLQRKSEVAESYKVQPTPSAVVIHPTGVIGSPVAEGDLVVEALVEQFIDTLVQGGPAADERSLGSQPFIAENGQVTTGARLQGKLLELTGEQADLSTLQDRDTIFLFWDSNSPRCQEMQSDVRSWEKEVQDRSLVQLVVIVSGSDRSNQTVDFRARVLIDTTGNVAHAFGVQVAPTAVYWQVDGIHHRNAVYDADHVVDLLRSFSVGASAGA